MTKKLEKIKGMAMRMLTKENGQGLVEYALILVLVAIVVMLGLKSVGQSTSSAFNHVNTDLGNP